MEKMTMIIKVEVEFDTEKLDSIEGFRAAVKNDAMKFGKAEISLVDEDGETLYDSIDVTNEIQETMMEIKGEA